MVYEFDKDKSKSNKDKHGIDFVQAQKLWEDPECVAIHARTTGEARKWDNKIWSVIFTIRNKKIRIISVRRSRKNEEEIYKN